MCFKMIHVIYTVQPDILLSVRMGGVNMFSTSRLSACNGVSHGVCSIVIFKNLRKKTKIIQTSHSRIWMCIAMSELAVVRIKQNHVPLFQKSGALSLRVANILNSLVSVCFIQSVIESMMIAPYYFRC